MQRKNSSTSHIFVSEKKNCEEDEENVRGCGRKEYKGEEKKEKKKKKRRQPFTLLS